MARGAQAQMSDKLTVIELNQLDELEAVIESGIKTFNQVGASLMKIRDSRLYRTEYNAFEDYCRERWGFTDRRARMLMAASGVMDNLSETGTIVPLTESQARPLAKLEPAEQVNAWTAAIEKAKEEGRKVTAKDVEMEVEIIVKPKKQEEVQQKEKLRPIGPPADGMQFARIAIMNLEQIKTNDVERVKAFNTVKDWIIKNEA
jgi:hypothetical protein